MANARDYVSIVSGGGGIPYFVARDNLHTKQEAAAVKREYVKRGHKVLIRSYRVERYPYTRYKVYASHDKKTKSGKTARGMMGIFQD